MLLLALGACLVIFTGARNARATVDISDVPLESMEQAAPGMIMFVIDDSGSMDWSMMCPPADEGDGVFDGNYYIFKNAGDNVYTSYYSQTLQENASDRMMWKSQWSGYNGMYYDPSTTYKPWPGKTDADPDNPRSNPMNSSPTFDMTGIWQEWGVVDNSDSGAFAYSPSTWSSGWPRSTNDGQDGDYRVSYDKYNNTQLYTAAWTDAGLDPTTTYTVQARWVASSSRSTAVNYHIYDNNTEVSGSPATVDQQTQGDQWVTIATGVSFSSGIGKVKISQNANNYQLCADAVRFVPSSGGVDNIALRHYFVHNANGTYLVNLLSGVIEYYKVNLSDFSNNHEVVTEDKLERLTDAQAQAAGIVTGRTYDEECQNFANWYSFYRRRIFTAKNAIGNVISTMDGVYIGLIFINNYNDGNTPAVPVKVNLDGTLYDDSQPLLDRLYGYNIEGQGTPLRDGLKEAGEYYQGNFSIPLPASFPALPSETSSSTYPYFTDDKGGSCQQAFTILFTDGYWNGANPNVGNADGDDNTAYDGPPFADNYSDTLADVAMNYYEKDLNSTLANNVPTSSKDPNDQQHMVTYTIAFGASGSLDVDTYKDCPLGTCPSSWPSASATDKGHIDDLFHAAVNGRGEYLSAANAAELNAALQALKKNIENRLGAAAALATNSIQRTVGSVIYQGTYNTANWYGELSALQLNVTTGEVGDAKWQASQHIPGWQDRTILSYNPSTDTGIVFDASKLASSQTTQLTASGLGTAQQIVDFIRGDTSDDVAHGGTLRTRNHPLGDIVHSAPTYFNNVVYIGANDGMLHAFNANDGSELFAYVPDLVYDHLSELADPSYSHKYYVDGSPTVATVGNKDILVCGLGKGGKGYFALDVTDPTAMDGTKVLWEYPTVSGASDPDMGYSFSQPFIVNTQAAGQVVIFSNGYDSANGHAVLYVLNPSTGALIKKFDTGAGGDNGLSTPAIVDEDMDGMVDYAYAGDLKGNMWKFDLRGASVSDWKISYMNGNTPEPLVTVKNENGQVQPITAAPEVILDCADLDQGRGLMVIFGTGKYLGQSDLTDNTVQSFYGIWDWGEVWEKAAGSNTAESKYLGVVNPDRSLSNLGSGITLVSQTLNYQDSQWGTLTDTQPDWYDPFKSQGSNMGWTIDMQSTGERCILQPTVIAGAAMLISMIPSTSPCTAGGSSGIYTVSDCSGGPYGKAVYDVDGDGKLSASSDTININGTPKLPQWHKSPKILLAPLTISGKVYQHDTAGNLTMLPGWGYQPGMFFWRVLRQ